MDLQTCSDFRHKLRVIKPKICLQETEETWDTIAAGINSLRDACDSIEYTSSPELVSELRDLQRPLTNAMVSERTRLSGAAIDLIVSTATLLGTQFETLLSVYFPSLLQLCSRANKVVAIRARAAVLSIIETTQLSSILPHLLHYSKDKATALRLVVAEGTLACLNCCNPPDLEKNSRVKEIEAIIRLSARDANADVRHAGRRIFEAYKLLFPSRVDEFTAPLTPTIRKYLDLKSSADTRTLKQPREPGVPLKSCNPSKQSSKKLASHRTHAEPSRVGIPNTTTFQYATRSTRSNSAPAADALSVGVSQSTASDHTVKPKTSKAVAASRLILSRERKDEPDSRSKNKSKMQITNVDTSGPRRIPLPNTQEVRKDVQLNSNRSGSGDNTSKPSGSGQSLNHSRNGSSRLNRPSTYKSEVAPNDQPAMATSRTRPTVGAPNGVVSNSQNKETRSVTQPTLAQLARVRRPVERKASGVAGTKPLWGRPSTRREAMKVSPKKGTKVHIKPNTRPGNAMPEEPAKIPLPASPILTPEVAALKETETLCKDVRDALCEIAGESAEPDQAMLQADVVQNTVVDVNDPKVESGGDSRPNIETCTPRKDAHQTFNIAEIRTPISALLESIEHGFDLTPYGELSPPQPYLTRGPLAGMTATLNIPFHLSSQAKGKTEMDFTEVFD